MGGLFKKKEAIVIHLPLKKKELPVNTSPDRVRGLDVSHYQGDVNWHYARASAFRFTFVKATDGIVGKDQAHDKHSKAAREADLLVGSYHFFRFNDDPVAQAKNFISTSGVALAGDLPPVLDIEWDRYSSKYKDGSTMDEEAALSVLTCLQEIERIAGIKPIIYTNGYFFTGFKNPERFSGYINWIPAYHTTEEKVHVPAPWKQWNFWQDAEDFAIDTVKAIDTNWFRGSFEELKALCKK